MSKTVHDVSTRCELADVLSSIASDGGLYASVLSPFKYFIGRVRDMSLSDIFDSVGGMAVSVTTGELHCVADELIITRACRDGVPESFEVVGFKIFVNYVAVYTRDSGIFWSTESGLIKWATAMAKAGALPCTLVLTLDAEDERYMIESESGAGFYGRKFFLDPY